MASSSKTCPGEIAWDYRRNELIADAVIHTAGIVLGLIGTITIILVAVKMPRIEVTPIFIYAGCLLTMLSLSAAYNMWPISPTKWLLRRFDHSAIYLLIAGTYTPFLTLMKSGITSITLSIGVWSTAALGMTLTRPPRRRAIFSTSLPLRLQHPTQTEAHRGGSR